MHTFMISYDLAAPASNKHALATAIMSIGASWARPLDHCWYVRSDVTETDIEQRLSILLADDDALVVQSVSETGVLTNTQLRWFRNRRPSFDVETGTNIVAFPSLPSANAAPELPFAAAI
jgi:hypothetical protein